MIPQLNVPRKYTALGQVWLSILLIVLAAIFAFTPIISMDMTQNDLLSGLDSALDEFGGEIPGLQDLEIPDEIGVTSGKVITSVSIFANLISVAMTDDADAAQEKADALQAKLESKDGQESMLMMLALVTQLIDFDEIEGNSGDDAGMIVTIIEMIMKIAIVFYLIIYITIWPFIVAIIALINLIRGLKNINTPEKVNGKVASCLIGPFAFAITLLFLLTFLPGFGWGSGLRAIFVLAIISIVANFVVSRLRAYNELDFKYATLVQGTALVQGIGFIVFFSNLVSVNFLHDFFKGIASYFKALSLNMTAVNAQIDLYNKFNDANVAEFTGGFWYLIDILLIMIFFFAALSIATTCIRAIIMHFTLAGNKKSTPNSAMSAGITALFVWLLPFVLTKLQSGKVYLFDSEAGEVVVDSATSLLILTEEGEGALTGMLVGAIIILAAGIVCKVLKGIFCEGITEERELLILHGKAPAYVTAAAAEETVEEVADETEQTEE